ncbi:hypothetical protein GW915_09085 [bacterium]|nr:hypothetical protein [bacterium]
MKLILVGQRGTGKTTLLRRLAKYLPDHDCVDLDSEIERVETRTIESIFHERGESGFRLIEKHVFETILGRFENFPNAVIALGAGFEFELPDEYEVIYVRRDSDDRPRVFFDRPNLDQNLSLRESYLHRAKKRKKKYKAVANRVWTMPEGSFFPCEKEKSLLLERAENIGGFLTLLPSHFELKDPSRVFQSYMKQGIKGFEFRDDLLNMDQFNLALENIPFEKRLFSFRENPLIALEYKLAKWVDWDIVLGDKQEVSANILSWHGKESSLEKSFKKLEELFKKAPFVKWAPEVESLSELKQIHEWRQQFASRLLFFPRTSIEGQLSSDWSWYRLLEKSIEVNFWRDAEGSSSDQPSLYRWHSCPLQVKRFAAVLGSPIKHSFSPGWHLPFFVRKDVPFFYIEMKAEEVTAENLEFLRSLGLSYAAVTSPLKERIFDLPNLRHDVRSQKYHSLNTLVWDHRLNVWRSTNTDFQGFHPLVEDLPRERVVIWGGGGTANVIKDLYPSAAHYSARSGELKSGVSVDPEILVWAAGATAKAPEKFWNPKYVVDLCYTQDSYARDYALKVGAKYRPGTKMFARQAMKQQAFWARYGD